jgi:predicted aconitase with swiveling domain
MRSIGDCRDRVARSGTVGSGVKGRVLAAGQAEGRALVLDEPLSLWGGMDPQSGEVIDARHPQHGAQLRGRVLVMPGVRGSSSSSSVLAEAVRAHSAPAAILLAEPDLILAVGAAVAGELYGVRVPVVVLAPDELAMIADGAPVSVEEDGSVT